MALPRPALPAHRYLIGGLSVASAVRLPGFESPSPHADVVIRAQPLPGDFGAWTHECRRFKASPGRWLFEPADGCRFLVENGRDVRYEAPPAVSPATVTDYVMQPVLATLLHQRELLALHASAVEVHSGAIVFIGARVAGKSTLAAWMHARGHGFVADDVCPVEMRGRPTIPGGFACQKLAPDALRELSLVSAATPIEGDGRGRMRVTLRTHPATAMPLTGIYVLRSWAGGARRGPVSIETLPRPAALEVLVEHTYRRQYLRGLGRLASHFLGCTHVAECVPIHQVSFSRDTCDVHAVGAAVRDHLRKRL
jgi:hypothetical protein